VFLYAYLYCQEVLLKFIRFKNDSPTFATLLNTSYFMTFSSCWGMRRVGSEVGS
jgi:hypothetical protein